MSIYQVKVSCFAMCERNNVVVEWEDVCAVLMPSYDGKFMVLGGNEEPPQRIPYDCPVCGYRRCFIVKVIPEEEMGDLTVEP